jgi:hypothetical protein
MVLRKHHFTEQKGKLMEIVARKRRQWKVKVKQRRKILEAMMDLEKIDDRRVKGG